MIVRPPFVGSLFGEVIFIVALLQAQDYYWL